MSLHKKISNLKDFDFYANMGIVADLLKKKRDELSDDEYNLLVTKFFKLFHWCHDKENEIQIYERISEEYREKIKEQEKELDKLKKLFKI